jgi:heme/copper-type cytochrome/quinol oxidase subunit 2
MLPVKFAQSCSEACGCHINYVWSAERISSMPEELVIILAILIGAIWLLVKICQAIAGVIYQAKKNRSEAGARRKENRYLEAKK